MGWSRGSLYSPLILVGIALVIRANVLSLAEWKECVGRYESACITASSSAGSAARAPRGPRHGASEDARQRSASLLAHVRDQAGAYVKTAKLDLKSEWPAGMPLDRGFFFQAPHTVQRFGAECQATFTLARKVPTSCVSSSECRASAWAAPSTCEAAALV